MNHVSFGRLNHFFKGLHWINQDWFDARKYEISDIDTQTLVDLMDDVDPKLQQIAQLLDEIQRKSPRQVYKGEKQPGKGLSESDR